VTLVVDASVIVSLLVGRPVVASEIHDRIAPLGRRITLDLADLEVMSALRRGVHRGEITAEDAGRAIDALADIPIRRHGTARLRERIWQLRATHTPYDAAYAALAERLGVPLVTTDRRLARSHGHEAEIIDLSA
jgi:predicted nucleic acid-binding protein